MNNPNQSDGLTLQNRQDAPGPQPQVGANYQFSKEEMRVLRECNRESFYNRSLPIGTALGLLTYYAVQKKYLRANLRFGAFPKVTGAVIFGYFLGKLSYQQKCAEKLMALPNSQFGELLRQRRNQLGMPLTPNQGGSLSMFGATAPEVYSDAGPNSSLDLDTDRPTYNLDSYRPSDLPGVSHSLDEKVSKPPGMSYDDLRKKNRDDHSVAKSQPYKVDEPTPPIIRARPEAPQKNKYGDVIGD